MTQGKQASVPFDTVVESVASRLSPQETALAAEFANVWLKGLDAGECVAGEPAADLAAAVLSHWNLLKAFRPGKPCIRVFDPQPDADGWSSQHTVVIIVTDDMPFLVDSVTMELNRRGLALHRLVHPVLKVRRDAEGALRGVAASAGADVTHESAMYLEIDRLPDASASEDLTAALARVLDDVRVSVEDWPAMRARMTEIASGLGQGAPADAGDPEEARALLQWLLADNFVLLGCRDHVLSGEGDGARLDIVPGSGLGLLRDSGEGSTSRAFAALPADVRAHAHDPVLLTVAKSNSRSTVHRPGYLDYVGVRLFDAQGQVCGERRILGLLASTAYSADPWKIPLLRNKVAEVTTRAGLLSGSHAAKALRVVLEQYPRDELFQIDTDTLFEHAIGILHLGERPRTRLFVRSDPFGRYVTCLVYVPREHYDTDRRRRLQAVLTEAFEGDAAEFEVALSDSPLARILFTVRTRDGRIPPYDVADIERRITEAARRWNDALRDVLVARHGELRGLALFAAWGDAFPAGYRERCGADEAADDVLQLEALGESGELGLRLFRAADGLRFKVYRAGEPVPLSSSLRTLERMGVVVTDEQPAKVVRVDGRPVWIHDSGLRAAGDVQDLEAVRPLFEETFLRVWKGEADDDEFNRLTLLAGLAWREVAVLRACARYLRQAAFPFSQAYIEQALTAHVDIARALVELFVRRFDPQQENGREDACTAIRARIETALDAVQNLDEDRILRQFLALIEAMLRTNWFVRDAAGKPRPVLSFKLDPHAVPGLPEPRPMFEIFVTSPRVEGVHLRGGKVARGGIRWSDRLEDFRTEVLGLVKAQIVKNAVIVPVGSKGGFVVRQPPSEGGREAFVAEGVACYRQFLSGMLDLTDNLVDGAVVPPQAVVRHDEDDPYLVVAADKGTATFSDHANAVAAEYGFWLDDAFASGGSAGYDHKKMGITARGAWESVKRHFRGLGRDIQNEDFTVVGVGDMSGDVFGNGMLLSQHIQLVAAFDHRHVFIDPAPDPAVSWTERARLFKLPRSSWDDYNRDLISQGGGIWPRSAKSIELSPEVRAVLGVEATRLAPAELIRAILRAPVDLLYNGGIGTYVKAAVERDSEVGDRANDAVRVNGGELRCRVVGEGGNLGFTQRGRIEFALTGGHIFTDAIDNSGGVDCSDHEVNIKILLSGVVRSGALTREARDVLLAEMTDEVATLVLADNYGQGQALETMNHGAARLLGEHSDAIRRLVQNGGLNRELEYLPSDDELLERRAAGQGLVTPELAVLLAYSKIALYDELLLSDVPDDSWVAQVLWRYFPKPLRERFSEAIGEHALRREIVATKVVNDLVNRYGASFVDRLRNETGASSADIVRAVLAAIEIFDLTARRREIEALDNQVPSARQSLLLIDLQRLVRSAVQWFLRNPGWLEDLEGTVKHFRAGVQRLSEALPDLLDQDMQAELEAATQAHSADGVPLELAHRVAGLGWLRTALDIVELAANRSRAEAEVGRFYFDLAAALQLHWLAAQIDALPIDGRWPALARGALRADLATEARRLVGLALAQGGEAEACVQAFSEAAGARMERYRALVGELRAAGVADAASLAVLLRELRSL